jgi:hypothetical protein
MRHNDCFGKPRVSGPDPDYRKSPDYLRTKEKQHAEMALQAVRDNDLDAASEHVTKAKEYAEALGEALRGSGKP